MSCVEIFAFDKNGDSKSYATFDNSWNGAMAIWNILGKKYCGHGASILNINFMKDIWNLMDNKTVPIHERIVLATTLDNCLVDRDNLPKVIESFRMFTGETSLKEQADILEEIYESNNYLAVGWHQNNISCESWFDYNFLKGNEHWMLFDELN